VIKELTQGVLKAVAKARERLATSKPALQRGRPSSKDKAARRRARKSKSIQQHINALFQERFLFVTRRLTPSERQRLMAITRGLPHLRKLREIMEHIYALFDRRCHTQTALGKLKQLRQWVKRFTWIGDALKKVFAPRPRSWDRPLYARRGGLRGAGGSSTDAKIAANIERGF